MSKNTADLAAFLREETPAIVWRYLLDQGGGLRQCGSISDAFGAIAQDAGFDAYVSGRTGHFYNVVRVDDGVFEVDMSAIQFEYDALAPNDDEEVERLMGVIARDPFRAIKVKRIPEVPEWARRASPEDEGMCYTPVQTHKWYKPRVMAMQRGERMLGRREGPGVQRLGGRPYGDESQPSHVLEAVDRQVALNAVREIPLPEDYDHLTLRRGRLATPDGALPVKKIGGGMFAEVYREEASPRRVFALVDDDVFDKDILSELRYDSTSPHIPAVEKFGSTRDKKVYAMPHYRAPLRKSDSPAAWEEAKVIRDCHEAAKKAKLASGYERNTSTVDCVRERLGDRPVVQALDDLVGYASNFSTEFELEPAPRNLATDEHGNLVLLDVLFDPELVHKRLNAKRKAREDRERARRRW